MLHLVMSRIATLAYSRLCDSKEWIDKQTPKHFKSIAQRTALGAPKELVRQAGGLLSRETDSEVPNSCTGEQQTGIHSDITHLCRFPFLVSLAGGLGGSGEGRLSVNL